MNILIPIISTLIVLAGIYFTVMPILPGPPIILAGILLLGIGNHFHAVSVVWILVFAGLTILSILLDVFGPALAARGYKASKYGAWGAFVGGLVGMFVLGPIGAIVGPFIGAFIGEYLSKGDHVGAWRTAKAALIGILLGTLFKFIVMAGMVVYFLVALIRNF